MKQTAYTLRKTTKESLLTDNTSQVEITAFFIRNWHLQGVLSEVFSDPVSVSTIYL